MRDQSVEEAQNTNTSDPDEWWSEGVNLLRENTLVTIANIAGQLKLNSLNEDVIQLYAHGLIHWSICKSNDAQDPLTTSSETSTLSPQRLAIETLSKMTINESNVDLVLATIARMPSFLHTLVNVLCAEWLVRRDDETLREFAIVLVTAMAKCDQFAARAIAKYVSFLIGYIEEFEEQTRRLSSSSSSSSSSSHVNNSNSSLEDSLGTTIDMLRRCANCIMYLAHFNENISQIVKFEHRLLDLTTSQYVDHKVVQTLAQVLFYCSSSHSQV
jgi:AT-rich interactive domain-containing protein 1